MDGLSKKLVEALDSIEEKEIKRNEVQMMDIPPAEVIMYNHGKSVSPIHKFIDEIRPNSLTESMTEENFGKASRTARPSHLFARALSSQMRFWGSSNPR